MDKERKFRNREKYVKKEQTRNLPLKFDFFFSGMSKLSCHHPHFTVVLKPNLTVTDYNTQF